MAKDLPIWVLILLVIVTWTGANISKRSLYDDDNIMKLNNPEEVDSEVLDASQQFVIVFYNKKCPNCSKHAESFKKFAHSVKDWKNVFTVAAIDCDAEGNSAVCAKYKVTEYPSIMLLPPHATKETHGKFFEGDDYNINEIQKSMIDSVSNDVKSPPSFWPDLAPVSYPNITYFWKDTAPNLNFMSVIVEPHNSYLGREIILSSEHLRPFMRLTRAIEDMSDLVDYGKDLATPYMMMSSRPRKGKPSNDDIYICRLELNDITVPPLIPDPLREPYIQYLEAMARNSTRWKGGDNKPIAKEWNMIKMANTNVTPSSK